ncbi:MAG TPA: alanine racemase, partial [Candidatus Baltobacteraceae bacterium]|nr:alanine racemase [Candidatus Baltobacteraceae bacterium]
MIAALGIDTGALRRNAERLATLVEPARFAAVVKANAYGHGLVAVARALQGVADMFCVYRGDEALALREAGVAEPILVLGPIAPRELAGVAAARAAITLWDEGTFARDAARVARGSGEPFAVHAKVDTGVARLGLPPERAADAIARYAREPAFALRGVYTHLAAAEELESAFTLDQLARFESALQPLEGALRAGGVVRHAAASAAAMLFPALRLDLVRVGIALYGIWP